MTYDSIYDAVYDLYDPDVGWEELVTVGDRESLNVAEEALGRHSDSKETALRIRDFDSGMTERYTFAELNDAANRVANYLEEHTSKYDRIGAMLPTRFELYAVVFGTMLAGRIYLPLSPMFGPDALNTRLADSGASVLFTTSDGYEKVNTDAANLDRVVTLDAESTPDISPDIEAYQTVESHDSTFQTVDTHPEDICALSYTSGTTGPPKGVPMTHRSRFDLHAFVEYVVDLRPDDVYFVAASPSWSYGLVIGTLMPGIRGTAIGCYRGEFSPGELFATFDEWNVDNAMLPPTALRQARAEQVNGSDHDVNLRVLITAGEALDAETVGWCQETLGAPPLNAYGMTEGGMVICNYAFDDWEIRPGSIGKPMPAHEIRLLDEDGVPVEQGDVGEISIKRDADADGTYWGRPQETVKMFSGRWRRTGDLARKDEDGYYWYVSRKDNVIISAGYRIGPEEVEETLLRHEAVTEAVVVGAPHETRGEIVKAYIVPESESDPSESLAEMITQFARDELSKHEYPREIEFRDELPKTATGKIKRTALEEHAS